MSRQATYSYRQIFFLGTDAMPFLNFSNRISLSDVRNDWRRYETVLVIEEEDKKKAWNRIKDD